MSIQKLYPDCISLALKLDPRSALAPTQLEIDRICQLQLDRYLQDNLGLNVKPIDADVTSIARKTNGFGLIIEGIRVAFILNEDIDTEGLEIDRSWFDLSLAPDYYVPIQIDLEAESASLWGFIASADVREQGEYESIARTYLVDSKYLDKDLDNLWLLCEFQADRAKLEQGSVTTKLSVWLDGRITAIDREWQSISEFFQATQERIKELTICPQATLMYRSTQMDTGNLAHIIHNTNSQHERWEAIENLWKIDPEHPALPIYKLIDLGLFFQGEKLSLLVSIVPTKNRKLGILIRLSPNDNKFALPANIKLRRLDENANLSREVIAQDRDYHCLQLIFDADFGDKFSACVILDNRQFVKHFEV